MKQTGENISAGIVLYNPYLNRLREVVDSILDQVELLILFDNGSDNINEIEKEFSNIDNILIVKSDKNLGISVALNKIAEISILNGMKWMLSLDHDSICPENIIWSYVKYLGLEKAAILCPIAVDYRRYQKPIVIEGEYDSIQECVQAGCLINLSIYIKLGGFDEWLFIDYVDFDYCKNAIINNYKIYRINSVVINQEFGDIMTSKIARIVNPLIKITHCEGLKKFTYYPIINQNRLYYSVRNRIYFLKKYWNNINKSREIIKTVKIDVQTLFRGKRKMRLVSTIVIGTRDGLKK